MKELESSLIELNNRQKEHGKKIEATKRRLLDAITEPIELSFQELERYAIEIINSYGVLSLAAERLDIGEVKLRNLIASNPELQEVRNASVGGLKGLVDKEIIKAVEDGDKDARNLLFKLMYGGRDRGGFNIREFGSTGDQDTAFSSEDKINQQGVHVHIHFEDNDAKRASDFSVDDIAGYVDGELVD